MKTLLIVDDERHMLHLLQYTLAKTGCRLLVAGSGEEAVQMASDSWIDLAVIDVGLPGIDGFETLEILRERPCYAALPAIILTARGQADLRVHALASQVLFMTKPFSPIELRRRILDLLGRADGIDRLDGSPVERQ